MSSNREQLFSVVGRMYVILRRETNRMVDVEWAICNAEYAREVIRLARSTNNAELMALSDRVEVAHPLLPGVKPAQGGPELEQGDTLKYVQSLR